MIRFFVARQYNETILNVLHWGAAFFRMAEQSIMMNPDPIVQTSANGFAFMGSMNQSKEDKEKHGVVRDYHILPNLLTLDRHIAISEVDEQEKEEKMETNQNSAVIRMITGAG